MALLLLLCAPAWAETRTEKRLTGLENRVGKVERRLKKLETGTPPAAAPASPDRPAPLPANPIGVLFLKKKQVLGQEKMGIRLYLEFENLSNRKFYAFNGELVFRDQAGAVIWRRPYGHSEPLGPGQRVEVSLGILSEQVKEYLRFVRATAVSVALEKQEVYGLE